jgi:hypothetical protein
MYSKQSTQATYVPTRPTAPKEKLTGSMISHDTKGELKRWNTRKGGGDVDEIGSIERDMSEDAEPQRH